MAIANNVTLNIDPWGTPFFVGMGMTEYCQDKHKNYDPRRMQTKTEVGYPLASTGGDFGGFKSGMLYHNLLDQKGQRQSAGA